MEETLSQHSSLFIPCVFAQASLLSAVPFLAYPIHLKNIFSLSRLSLGIISMKM